MTEADATDSVVSAAMAADAAVVVTGETEEYIAWKAGRTASWAARATNVVDDVLKAAVDVALRAYEQTS
jgi:hypothetical protein